MVSHEAFRMVAIDFARHAKGSIADLAKQLVFIAAMNFALSIV